MKLFTFHKFFNLLKGRKSESSPCIPKNKTGMFLFQIVDADSNIPLEGAKFTLSCNGSLISTSSSDPYGRVLFPCVHPGIYYLREITPPEGYQLKRFDYQVMVDQYCTVTIDDMPAQVFKVLSKKEPVIPKYSLVLYKLDGGSEEMVEGATFRLHNDEVDVVETSGEDGELDFGFLHPGTYTLSEVDTPIGYMPKKKEYVVEIGEDGTIAIDGESIDDFKLTNTLCTGFGVFRKTIEGTPVEGITMEFRQNGKAIRTETTNADGYASFECFPPGGYILAETLVPEGYSKDGTEYAVTAKEDGKIWIGEVETFEWEWVVENVPIH